MGSKLPIILSEKKLRVADVVRAAGISKSTLHKLYNEESSKTDFNAIDQLCEFLDVQVGDLFIYKPNTKDKIVKVDFAHYFFCR
ncbi:helix-turn-helix transcriptional regulator [Psychrobacter frigidicola]|uniref:Helix-turn-helix transcriptional regulator n=1 Tax=Psychrobacter frigidicola TaxID=45611 RepID=A0A5C7A5T8_9GAMM|nr:helix-turn-helix transcriptional regulator [Psychrobacter frigidicola]TXD98632.1 helix-turn-helix transcriptional regulator [Psychrobacter frigidicola]